MADLIKTITVGTGEAAKQYEIGTTYANVDGAPADQTANVANLKTIAIKLAKKTDCEDLLAHDLYPELPVIAYTVADTLTGAKILKGNATDAAELEPIEEGKTVVYNKTAANGYSGDLAAGDYQFNMSVVAPVGKIAKAITSVEQGDTTYNNLRATLQDATTNTWRIQATKVKVNMDVAVVEGDPFTVTFINNTEKTLQNVVGSAAKEITDSSDVAVPGADYKFKIVEDPELESKHTADMYLAKVEVLAEGETYTDITDTVKAVEGYIDFKKKGDEYTISGSLVTNNLRITLTPADTEESSEQDTTDTATEGN